MARRDALPRPAAPSPLDRAFSTAGLPMEDGLPQRADVVIVGAGPAGSAAALAVLAARPRAHVVLADRARFPRDKACGDGVAPFALEVLAGLGVDPAAVVAGSAPVTRLHFRTPGRVDVVQPLREPDWVVPRVVLDARLAAAAVAAGAHLHRHTVREITRLDDGVLVDGCRARTLIAADGVGSTVRRHLGLTANAGRDLALAVRGYAPTPPGSPPDLLIDMVERGWPAYAWHFPVGNGWSNVGFGTVRSQLPAGDPRFLHRTLAELLPETPGDPATLRAAHLPLSTSRPRQPDGRVLLAGDAASLVNPLTGEGIFYAVLSGMLAGRAATGPGDPGRAYRSALRRELGRHLRHTSALAVLSRRPRLVDAAVRAGGRSEPLFAAMVELGLGRGLVPARLLSGVAGGALRTRVPGLR